MGCHQQLGQRPTEAAIGEAATGQSSRGSEGERRGWKRAQPTGTAEGGGAGSACRGGCQQRAKVQRKGGGCGHGRER